jgi:hypothetical protein
MMKYVLTLLLILSSAVCSAKELTGWPIGSWDCRSWGGIALHKDGWCTDIDAEGDLSYLGNWQWFDKHTVIICWEGTAKIDFIYKDPETGKFWHEDQWGFGAGSKIKKCKKTFTEEDK